MDLDWCLACESQLDSNLQCPRCPSITRPHVKIMAPQLSMSTTTTTDDSEAGTIFHCIELVASTEAKPRREINNWLARIPSQSPSAASTSSLTVSSPTTSTSFRSSSRLSRTDSISTLATSRSSLAPTLSSSLSGASEPTLLARHRIKRAHATLGMSAPRAEAVRPTPSSSSAHSVLPQLSVQDLPLPPPRAQTPKPTQQPRTGGLLAYLQQRSSRRRAARKDSASTVTPTSQPQPPMQPPKRKFDFSSRADARL